MERRTCRAQQATGGKGGSGAGGGGNDGDNEEGAGGGGSGGTVYLVAATLYIEGAITATGGLGGRDDYIPYRYRTVQQYTPSILVSYSSRVVAQF